MLHRDALTVPVINLNQLVLAQRKASLENNAFQSISFDTQYQLPVIIGLSLTIISKVD